MTEVVHVTDAPAPYREPVHQLVNEHRKGDYHVVSARIAKPTGNGTLRRATILRASCASHSSN